MKTVEEYAIDLVCDGARSCAEDDLNEDGDIAEDDHQAACDLALALVRAIRANPQAVLALVGRGSVADHLNVSTSGRGFDRLPPIPSEYGGDVQVYESSAAMGPHVWLMATAPADLNDPTGPTREAPIHLTAENAAKLADQLRFLVEHHYQTGG